MKPGLKAATRSLVARTYRTVNAVDEIDFQIEPGEVVGFLGPNGAGKTTTMRILTGYMPPTYGAAKVAGFDIVSESIEVRRRVGYLPETVPLYPAMTVFEYLKFMADLRHLPQAENMVDNALALVGMELTLFVHVKPDAPFIQKLREQMDADLAQSTEVRERFRLSVTDRIKAVAGKYVW